MNPPSKKNTCNLSLSLSRSFAHPQREHPPWSCLAFFFFFFLFLFASLALSASQVLSRQSAQKITCINVFFARDRPPPQSVNAQYPSKQAQLRQVWDTEPGTSKPSFLATTRDDMPKPCFKNNAFFSSPAFYDIL